VRVAGIAVKILTRNRPALRLVVVSDDSGAPSIEATEEFTSDDTDLPTQLSVLAKTVESRLKGLAPDRVIVRRADMPIVANKRPGPQLRLLAEGAATSSARSVVPDTLIGSGKDVGGWAGSDKASADAAAETLLIGHSCEKKYTEAACAALAGLALP
jgi:hypothetical protein